MTKRTTWFLHAKDAHSNEVISRTLNELQTIDTAKEHECADRKKRFLYETPDHAFAQRLIRSQAQLSASFVIYCSKDGGKPTEVNFDAMQSRAKKATLPILKQRSDVIKMGAAMPKHRR
jgi:hypothetical protein